MSWSQHIIYPQIGFLKRSRSRKTPLFPLLVSSVSWQIKLRHVKAATQLQSWIWAVNFLLFLYTDTQFETKYQSLPSVQIRTDTSGNHSLPWKAPRLALELELRVECSSPRAKAVSVWAQKAVGGTSACGSLLSYHREKLNVTVSTGSKLQEQEIICLSSELSLAADWNVRVGYGACKESEFWVLR